MAPPRKPAPKTRAGAQGAGAPKPFLQAARVWIPKSAQHNPLGGRVYGTVYAGRVKFADGSVHRVAVKRFHREVSDALAARYQKCIDDLHAAGVRIPKMGMAQIENEEGKKEWVQVSQLFGSLKKGSKFTRWNVGDEAHLKKMLLEIRKDYIEQVTRIANAGYTFHRDVMEGFSLSEKGVMPLDIDQLVHMTKPAYNARQAAEQAKRLANNPQERRALAAVAFTHANPKIKAELKELLPSR